MRGFNVEFMAASGVEAERVTLVGHGDLRVRVLSPAVDAFKALWPQGL